MSETSYPREKIKILLLEGCHPTSVKKLSEHGYSVDNVASSLSPEELLERIGDVHILGIRSKTKVGAEHIQAGKRLLGIGCFGVGTNQVDLDAARAAGVPVFNAPYGNTRSVAELALGSIIMLARKAGDANAKMHQKFWEKTAKGCYEIREKTLGIVGYGHIGQQLGLLAESVGMRIAFYDKQKKLALGNAQAADSLEALLERSDFVSLHVPGGSAAALIGVRELSLMKRGSFLLNLSRGTLIDFAAVKEAIGSGRLGGVAIDVYPKEPKSNSEPFECELAGVKNVFLTPHIGGSTEEAQENIGVEVADSFLKFIDGGDTFGAVNFPQVSLPAHPGSHRVLNVHKNVPGVLGEVNRIVSELGANINAQYLSTYKDVGYLVMDIGTDVSTAVADRIKALPTNIKTRTVY